MLAQKLATTLLPYLVVAVYYRVRINFTDLPYEKGLESPDTAEFMIAAEEITNTMERLYSNSTGEQYVTVINFEKAKDGILVTLDIGSADHASDAEVQGVLDWAVESGRVGHYRVSKLGYEFRSLKPDNSNNGSTIHASPAVTLDCAEYEFQCADGSCIDVRRKCDGSEQCPDGSDENDSWARCNVDPSISNVSPTTTIETGKELVLRANVEHLGTGTVLWVKAPDNILVIGGTVVVPDGRISSYHVEGDSRYEIRIRDIKPSDAGQYALWVDLRNRKLTTGIDVYVQGGTPPTTRRPPPRRPRPVPRPQPPPERRPPPPRREPPTRRPPERQTEPPYRPPLRPAPIPKSRSHSPPSHAHRGRCPQGYLECESRHCLGDRRWCDGVSDCPDGDDEKGCSGAQTSHPVNQPPTGTACAADQYRCKNGQCIAIARFCDGSVDCTDASDENDRCPGLHHRPTCPRHHMQCRDGTCVDLRRRCDGRSDCPDGYDEEGCPGRETPRPRSCRKEVEFKCIVDDECIDARRVCDGRADCRDASDERNCPTHRPPTRPPMQMCADGSKPEFSLSGTMYCWSHDVCPSGTACKDGMCCKGERTPCWGVEFQCNNSQCVNFAKRCNGVPDCTDGSDELNCEHVNRMSQPNKMMKKQQQQRQQQYYHLI